MIIIVYQVVSVKNMINEDKERIDKMENQLIDMRLAVSALLETATHHQRNFDTIQRNFETMQRNFDTLVIEIRDMRSDMMQMQSDIKEIQTEIKEIQTDVRGLQTENRRILDILQNRPPEQES